MLIETPSQTTPRQDLIGPYYEFDPASEGFIANRMAPDLSVVKRKGVYAVIPRDVFLQRINTKRARKSPSSTSDYTTADASFELTEYAHKGLVDGDESDIFSDWFSEQELEAQRVARIIDTDREADCAALYINETTYPIDNTTGHAIAGGSEWDNKSGADPIGDITKAKERIWRKWRIPANTLELTYNAVLDLSRCDQIQSKLTQAFGPILPSELEEAHLRTIFKLPNIVIAGAGYNSANPGATVVASSIWNDDYAWVGRVDNGPNPRAPQAGRFFTLDPGSALIRSWLEEDPEGMWIRAKRRGAFLNVANHAGGQPIGYLVKNLSSVL